MQFKSRKYIVGFCRAEVHTILGFSVTAVKLGDDAVFDVSRWQFDVYASVTVLDNTPKHNRAFVDIEPEPLTPCLEWQYSAGLAIWTFRQQLRQIAYTAHSAIATNRIHRASFPQ